MSAEEQTRRLLREHGRTFAAEAGVTLRDTPAPLYQLLVLAMLCSTRIKAGIAVAAARELFRAGLRTPRAMADAEWQDVVDALGRAHYRRYDESSATALHAGAELVLERWHGDLRRLRAEAGGETSGIHRLLQEVPRIGPVGADIFCREAQAVWPGLYPFFDRAAREQAAAEGLPKSAEELGRLVRPADAARLAAALVRVRLGADDSSSEAA
ncbi:endonuclease [Kitasatospora sp. NPDC052896]|uniref:endonuclease n=1 Tax=Kitasatospora sp. NPDC052896 TaxID=3364061 RepID=UPI0037C80582